MKRFGYLAFVIVIGLAFVAGYWPQHKKWFQAQGQLIEVSVKLTKSEAKVRLCHLQSQLVSLLEETENKNYADASALSTKFFDGVRQESDNTPPSSLKSSLESTLNQRDAVTAALAKGDPKARDLLAQLLADLNQSIIKSASPPQPKP
jgi:hypothetical protein